VVGVSAADEPAVESPSDGAAAGTPPERDAGGVASAEDDAAPEGVDPWERDRPPRVGVAIATAAALVSALALAAVPAALPAGLVGVLAIGAGTARSSGRAVTIGLTALVVGVGIAGLLGAGPEPLLVAGAGALVAWDAGVQAVDLGETLMGAEASRPLVVHVAVSTGVASGAAGAGYAVFRLAAGQRPFASLVLMLVGALVILAALRS